MELGGHEIAPANGGGIGAAVCAGGGYAGFILRYREIRVYVVEVRGISHAGPERGIRLRGVYAVPAHVRHLEAGVREAAHMATQNTQAGGTGAFLAAVEKNLVPDTDAQEWLVLRHPSAYGFHQSLPVQRGGAIPEGTYARQHQVGDFKGTRHR